MNKIERPKVRANRGITIGLEYEIEIRDKDGKLLSKCKGKNDPFVKNWIRQLYALIKCAEAGGSESITDTSGVSRTFLGGIGNKYVYTIMGWLGIANSNLFGIQVGTSDIAFSKEHYQLQGLIAHGTGSGQLVYGTGSSETITDEDTTTRVRFTRVFTNNSGAPITVKEIGIVSIQYNYTDTTKYYFLCARDVLTSPQTIPDGASLTVRYRVYISYA